MNRVATVTIGTVFGAIWLVCSVPSRSRAQSKAPASADIYALMDVVWDLPAGFEPYSKENIAPGKPTKSTASNHGYGTKELPSPARFSKPIRKESGDVRLWIAKSPSDAMETIMPGNDRFHYNLRPAFGSCSGKPIGDVCTHTIMGSPHPFAAALWFTRGNIAFYVDLRGSAKDNDWPKAAEKLAATLVARADAVKALSAARMETVQIRSHKLNSRTVAGEQVVHCLEYAEAVGATTRLDAVASTFEVKSGKHVLLLHVGTEAGMLDGKPISLSFPALRDGSDDVDCPIAALRLVDR